MSDFFSILLISYLPAGVVGIGVSRAGVTGEVRVPPEQIVRLRVVVVFPPEAVAVKLLRQRPCAGIVVVRDQRLCLAYLDSSRKPSHTVREVVRCGGIPARAQQYKLSV